MQSHLIAVVLGAILAAIPVWFFQESRLHAREAEIAEANAEQLKLSRQAERTDHERIAQAVKTSRSREVVLRRNVLGLRVELDGVRRASAESVRLSEAATGACPERARALQAVFDQCAGVVAGLAENADRHAADALMLLEAWPRADDKRSDVASMAASGPSRTPFESE